MAASAQEAEDDQAWAQAWDEAEEELEMEQQAAPAYLLLLPQEILCRVLGFLSHSTLVNAVFRVDVRLSNASAVEARTRTQHKLLDALIAGFGDAAEATRPRLWLLATQLEKALAAGSARYHSKCRQLIFNLKDHKNPDLRARLLSGDISTADLLRLTAQQVAASAANPPVSGTRHPHPPQPHNPPRALRTPHAPVRIGSWPAASYSSSARSGDVRASCVPCGPCAVAATRPTCTAATSAGDAPRRCTARSAPDGHTSTAPPLGPPARNAGTAGRSKG